MRHAAPLVRALLVAALLVSVAAPPLLASPPAGDGPVRLAGPSPAPVATLVHDHLALGGNYDPAIPTQQALLGFGPGDRVATPAEIVAAFRAWDEASPRASLFEHAKSHEGRSLVHLVITSEANLARLDEIQRGMQRLTDPRGVGEAERRQLVDSLPGVAWMGYSIHGNETSGADAALAVAYHLLADRSAATAALREELVVVIDPSLNPDGRQRFAQDLVELRGSQPNLDDQAMQHRGGWPFGRGNHFLFDLNRDALFGIHPETRGRIAALRAFNPLLYVDGHEMGAQDTFLFSPAREPINPHHPNHAKTWGAVFARDQAAAFDRRAWPYYHGEWNDDWYPGYANAWQQLRGAVSILYEQARVAEGGVLQANGQVLSYREAVAHQAVSSLANLETLRRNRREIFGDYAADRLRVLAADSPYAGRGFALPPSGNGGRVRQFLELMAMQGIEVHRLTRPATVTATDALGERRSRELPAGTLFIANRQPEARLVAAILELDPRLARAVLAKERKELLARGDSTMYDWTAWSLPLLFGLPALEVASELPSGAELVTDPAAVVGSGGMVAGAAPADAAPLLLALPGEDDRTVAAAARLMERGVVLRALDEATVLDGQTLGRGSVVAMRRENADGFADTVAAVAGELGLPVVAVRAGLGDGDLADIGGGHFDLLTPPRVGVMGRGSVSTYDFGNLAYVLDQRLGIRYSALDEGGWRGLDLRRYNVIVVPDRGGALPAGVAASLRAWVEQGGTLIAIGRSAAEMASEAADLSAVRRLGDVLGKLEPFQVAIHREWQARQGTLADDAVLWSRDAPLAPQVPWAAAGRSESPGAEELARRDAWQELFMPQGAILAARVDPEHWLTFGTPAVLPVLYAQNPVLLAGDGVEAPLRLGTYVPAKAAPATASAKGDGKSGKDDKGEAVRRVGWAPLPDGQDLRIRLSGLLWPEAAQRLASAAYLTREARGNGQIILFAAPPSQRGGTVGTIRLLENAVVFGPGLGADQPVIP